MKKGRLVLITLTLCLVTSCHYSNKALDSAYGLMQERPDSALVILQQWQRNNPHPSKGNEARHALLLSMALDKNYIDLQSDSIIDKAVRYYAPRKGRERMLAYYYQGRILQNRSPRIAHSKDAAATRGTVVEYPPDRRAGPRARYQ